jgi:hypothetical protein
MWVWTTLSLMATVLDWAWQWLKQWLRGPE